MKLFFEEHKRLWRRRSVRLCVLLVFLYAILFGGVLNFGWLTFGSVRDETVVFGNRFDGRENIRKKQEFARRYGGTLTDTALQEMVSDYQKADANNDEETLKMADSHRVTGWLVSLYPDLRRGGYDLMTAYASPSSLTDLYGRRQQAIEDVMTASGFDADEMAFLRHINTGVETPFAYAWTEGWAILLSDTIPELTMLYALTVIVCLSPLFAGAWHDRTAELTRSTRFGLRKCAYLKALSGFLFAAEVFALLTVFGVFVQWLFFGTDGNALPVQLVKMITVVPFTMRSAERFEYTWLFASLLGFAGVVMLLSATMKRTGAVVAVSAALFFLPDLLAERLPYRVQKILMLFPFGGDASDLFRMYVMRVFGTIWFLPYLEMLSAAAFAAISLLFVGRVWGRKVR